MKKVQLLGVFTGCFLLFGMFWTVPVQAQNTCYSASLSFDPAVKTSALFFTLSPADMPPGFAAASAKVSIRLKMVPPQLPNLVVLCRDENTTLNRNDPASVVGYINYVQNPYSTRFYTTTFTLKDNQVAWLLKDGSLQFLVTTLDYAGANFYADHAGMTACQLVPSEALFSVSGNDGRAPFAVEFTDQSLGNPTSWQWDFGDGADLYGTPPHPYLSRSRPLSRPLDRDRTGGRQHQSGRKLCLGL